MAFKEDQFTVSDEYSIYLRKALRHIKDHPMNIAKDYSSPLQTNSI
jgi:hypothetical protein